MKKRYLFGLLAIALAVGLAFNGCDLLGGIKEDGSGAGAGTGAGNGDTQEPYENLVIMGKADGKVVKTTFSTTRTFKKQVMTPQSDDSYEILYDSALVSKGKIEASGTTSKTITFKPNTGTQFQAVLNTTGSSPVLAFPDDIHTSTGEKITGYMTDGSTVVTPEFTTDLDNASTITLTVNETKTLTVAVETSTEGGAVSYQWYKAAQSDDTGTAITGATSASYTVPTSTAGTSFYYVMASNTSGGFRKSKVVQVTVTASPAINIRVGATQVTGLPTVIETLLGSNTAQPYTVILTADLASPLFVSPKNFPGTGKLTIKSEVPLTKGIHITRSNVELNGLSIMIVKQGESPGEAVPKYQDGCLCAVMVSDRYYWDGSKSYDAVPENPKEPVFPQNKAQYENFATKTINKVEIVNCRITFLGSTTDKPMLGICVDPYTVGRAAADRVKIKDTEVYVDNNNTSINGRCFMGDFAELSDNIFTSTKDVLDFEFLYDKVDNIIFTKNKFTTTKENGRVAIISINASYGNHDTSHFNPETSAPKFIGGTNGSYPAFGSAISSTRLFSAVPANYKTFITNLFDQIQNKEGKFVRMSDFGDWFTSNPYTTTGPSSSEYYQMKSGDIKVSITIPTSP